MPNYSKILIEKYFDENSFVMSDIESFDYFVDKELQKVIEENKIIEKHKNVIKSGKGMPAVYFNKKNKEKAEEMQKAFKEKNYKQYEKWRLE